MADSPVFYLLQQCYSKRDIKLYSFLKRNYSLSVEKTFSFRCLNKKKEQFTRPNAKGKCSEWGQGTQAATCTTCASHVFSWNRGKGSEI